MISILLSVFIIFGTIIGAGFASGKEIAVFFNCFAGRGTYGLIISAILFGIVVYFTLSQDQKSDYENIFISSKYILYIMKAFAFICFCTMISAIGTYCYEIFNVSFWYGAIFSSIVCLIFYIYKFKSLEKINLVLVPLIIVGIVLIGMNSNEYTDIATDYIYINVSPLVKNWLFSAILYASYNSILLIPILLELKNYKLSKMKVCFASILVAILFYILGFTLFNTINTYYYSIIDSEIPMIEIAKNQDRFVSIYYGFVMLFAVFTTAFSAGFAFLKMCKNENYITNALIMCIAGVLLSKIGFSNMINMFFPVFGYLGILQFVLLMMSRREKK